MKLTTLLLLLSLPLLAQSPQRQPLTAASDATPKPTPRASMVSFSLPSHGVSLNAFVYVAAGAGPHPAVVLLHGFPGNEKNLDLAQAIRRAGWDVLFFNYRGSWGSPGDFSFGHSIEDTAAAVAYLRDPTHARQLRLDPKRIVLVGHSMGGFMAVEAGANDRTIAAVGLISAADMAGRFPSPVPPGAEASLLTRTAAGLAREGMAPLAGCTPDGLARELLTNTDRWRFATRAPALASRPVLIVTSDDGLAPANTVFAEELRADGDTHITTAHFATDHAYSDDRLELTGTVLSWLGKLSVAPPAPAQAGSR